MYACMYVCMGVCMYVFMYYVYMSFPQMRHCVCMYCLYTLMGEDPLGYWFD